MDLEWLVMSFETLNTTLHDYLAEFNDTQRPLSLGFMVSTLFIGSLNATVGNVLLYCVHIYEKYGVDSMRRTATNILISQACAACIYIVLQNYTLAAVHNRKKCNLLTHEKHL